MRENDSLIGMESVVRHMSKRKCFASYSLSRMIARSSPLLDQFNGIGGQLTHRSGDSAASPQTLEDSSFDDDDVRVVS